MTRKAMSELTLRNEALALVSERRPARTQLHVHVCGVCPNLATANDALHNKTIGEETVAHLPHVVANGCGVPLM